MQFLAPLTLWGPLALAGASIPIALHFFYRSRYRVVPWAAMEFLLTSIQQTSRRLKFQEILLLAARVALMLMLALTMLRPSCSSLSSAGRGEAVDAVLLIDNSYSMTAKEGGQTRLDRAKDAANKILDSLPPSSSVQIISCANRADLLGPYPATSIDKAKQIVEALEPTDLATDFLPAANEALKALKVGYAANKEVYLLSDMQKLGWEQQDQALKASLDKVKQQATLYLVRCGSKSPHNVAILGIRPASHFPQTGERAGYVVEVRNTGEELLRDVTVTLEIDGQTQDRDARTIDKIAPHEKKTVSLTAKPKRPGLQILTATLGPDDIAADNRFDQVVNVRDKVRVLVVDGAPNDRKPEEAGAYYLVEALRSIGQTQKDVVQTRLTTAAEASAAFLTEADVCVLVDAPLKPSALGGGAKLAPAFLKRLDEWVKEGRGLIIYAGPRVDAKTYNEVLFDQYALLPMKLAKPYTTPRDRLVLLDPDSVRRDSYLGKFRDPPYNKIITVNLTTAYDLESPGQQSQDTSKTLLSYTNGKPAIVAKQHGVGEVLFCTTTANATWTDWPKSIGHSYVPFLTETLKHLLQGPLAQHNRRAGDSLVYHPQEVDETTEHVLLKPGGAEVRLKVKPPDGAGERATVASPAITRAGIYRILPVRGDTVTRPEAEKSNEPAGALYAVTPDLRESEDLSTYSDKEIDDQLGFRPVHLVAGEGLTTESVVRSSGEWWWYILLAVIGIAAFETGLAWFCSRAW
jgi:hypothetical protein